MTEPALTGQGQHLQASALRCGRPIDQTPHRILFALPKQAQHQRERRSDGTLMGGSIGFEVCAFAGRVHTPKVTTGETPACRRSHPPFAAVSIDIELLHYRKEEKGKA